MQPAQPDGLLDKEELERVASLCVEHDVTLCSDEVWGEVPLEPSAFPFTSMLSLLSDGDGRGGIEGLAERLIVLTSPSKCFNVAPLDIALAIIPDPALRQKFRSAGSDAAEVSCFGYSAAVAAYGESDDSCLLDEWDHAAGCRRWASGAWCRRRPT